MYDSQSQPLEVRSIPGLWQPYSAAQNYTQAQARELIAFAFARGIRVLPEFDMPGACTRCAGWGTRAEQPGRGAALQASQQARACQ